MAGNILGVIPARSGSKGVPGKNLLPLGGTSLLGIAIRGAKASRCLTRTIVSTEDDGLRDEALAHGANVPFKRPAALATDTAGTWDVMRHAVDWLAVEEGWHTDILVVLQPTTPFREARHIDAVVDRLTETGAAACIAMKPVDYPPQWMYRRAGDGVVAPLNDGPWPRRRQDAEPAFQPNGMVYALRADRLDAPDPLAGITLQSVVFDTEESINIDEWWHYNRAKILWKND